MAAFIILFSTQADDPSKTFCVQNLGISPSFNKLSDLSVDESDQSDESDGNDGNDESDKSDESDESDEFS